MISSEMKRSVRKEKNVTEKLTEVLEKVPGIILAFVYGGSAKAMGNPETEIDVMVVGGADLQELDSILPEFEKDLGKAFNTASYTLAEFRERIKVGDELVTAALKGPKLILIGDEAEMG
jgi:predicted nucleotidyltransferase